MGSQNLSPPTLSLLISSGLPLGGGARNLCDVARVCDCRRLPCRFGLLTTEFRFEVARGRFGATSLSQRPVRGENPESG